MRIRWTERTFNFDFPVETHPELLERLRGTPARIADRLAGVEPSLLIDRPGGKWSLQEHAGHLADLDDGLMLARVEEFERRATALQPADMSNRKTEQADHNARSLEEVLGYVRRARRALVGRLEGLAPEVFGHSAFHPRLKVPMRLVDLMFFIAEHDDHHLASMTGILRALPCVKSASSTE
jgi:uncharacterized damage-inducible protein DinB